MAKAYRIGLIGIGGIATMHANAIADLPNATLVAGTCRTEDKGRAFAAKFKCNWYPDYEQMLAQEKLDMLVDYRYTNELPLVVTTNLGMGEVAARIASRLQREDFGRVVNIKAEEYRLWKTRRRK